MSETVSAVIVVVTLGMIYALPLFAPVVKLKQFYRMVWWQAYSLCNFILILTLLLVAFGTPSQHDIIVMDTLAVGFFVYPTYVKLVTSRRLRSLT
jgi:hypothetical protein